jgi:hypothetical protein
MMMKLLMIFVILLNTACAEPVHKCPSFNVDKKIGCGIKKDTW